MTPTNPEALRAMAEYDAEIATCPFQKRKAPPSSRPCPKCGATASESCRVAETAVFKFVASIRTALQEQDNGK